MIGLAEAVAGALPDYEIPDDDLVGEVLVPAMKTAQEVRIGAGFFSSQCLAQIAPGLADFLTTNSCPLRLMISPEIDEADRHAIDRGLRTPQQVIDETIGRLFDGFRLSASAVVQHTLDCLAYLVASERLEVRFVLMDRGMYHKKKWLFRDAHVWLAVHGSGNATSRGLLVNGEQMTVDRPWMDGPAATERTRRLVAQWDRQWNNRHPRSVTLEASQGLRFAGRHGADTSVPTAGDFWTAWKHDHQAGLEPPLPPNVTIPDTHILTLPAGMNWKTGAYAHQGRAVEKFLEAGRRGVLAIATGGGKTRTALIAATECQNSHMGPMLVLVLVPSRPLLHQWANEIGTFGINPVVPSSLTSTARNTRYEEITAAFSGGNKRTEVMVVTNKLYAEDENIRSFIDTLGSNVLTFLIGDEMHNLGVPSFLGRPPARFDCRLGLSATPIRQYDPDGTDRLFAYFGPEIDKFDLGDAIAAGCLTPYDYCLHEVTLTSSEMDKYVELTEQLRALGFRVDDVGQIVISNPQIERLLRERRAVLEQAEAKLARLRELLLERGPATIRRTLIYTSAKSVVFGNERQIEKVNRLLSELAIISHQFTSAETPRPDAQIILEKFGRGDYQVLTAMKVLDEGIDIPQTDTAYLLASSTVRREWVQRRGRILRRTSDKTHAVIHDFIVLPPYEGSKEGNALLKGELARAEEFVHLARNEWSTGGPRHVMAQVETLVWGGHIQ